MSQALCLVDRATCAGSFRCVPYERCLYRVLSSPFSRGRGIMPHSPSLCTVHFLFSLASSQLSTLMPCPLYRTPLPSPFFLLFVDMTTRTPASLSGPPLLSFYFPSSAHAGSAPCLRPYLHSMHRLCIPSLPHTLLVCCASPPFAAIRSPWSLFFFFIPIPLTFGAELRDPVAIVKQDLSV